MIGRVLVVRDERLGGEVIVSATILDDTLALDSVADFDETGGSVVNGVGEAVFYFAADYDTNVLSFDAPLGTPADNFQAGDWAAPYSDHEDTQRIAEVDVGEGPPLVAVVPHSLRPLLPLGTRDPGTGEQVEVAEVDGEMRIIEVLGRQVQSIEWGGGAGNGYSRLAARDYVEFAERNANPGAGDPGQVRLFSKVDAGVARPFAQLDDGSVHDLTDTGGGGGAPSTADYLVGTSDGGLSAEIVVGTTPGGELGNTWASPTVDTTHSGSSHAGAAAAETADIRAADVLVGTATSAFSGEIAVGTTPGGELGNTWASPTVDSTHSGSSHAGAAAAETADIRSADVLVGTATAAFSGEIVAGTSPGGELGGTWGSPTVDSSHAGSTHAGAAAAETADIRAVDVLVGTATSAFSGEIVAGTTPGGELGGTWGSPTVDATHSGSAHHAQTHDAADHTDVTRYFYHMASPALASFGQTSIGSPANTNVGTVPDRAITVQFADAATTGVYFTQAVPADAKAASPLLLTVIWAPASTDATPHTVRWSVDALAMVGGTLISATGTTTAWTGDSAARTAADPVYETPVQILASVSAGQAIRMDFRRIGGDGADTYVGATNIIALRFEYTATG